MDLKDRRGIRTRRCKSSFAESGGLCARAIERIAKIALLGLSVAEFGRGSALFSLKKAQISVNRALSDTDSAIDAVFQGKRHHSSHRLTANGEELFCGSRLVGTVDIEGDRLALARAEAHK